MSFKGDLSTIGLAEVFQMISMSQKEGTLIVQDEDSRKCIFFGSTGIQLLSSGKRKGMRVGDMLVRAGKITQPQLEEALESAGIQKKLVGEVLVENGVITGDDIQSVVRVQIEEEIYDLFIWKKANFEFIEGPAPDNLKDPEARATKLAFDVNGLLLEAVRRADEWQLINQEIPSIDSIFVFASEGEKAEEEKNANPVPMRVIYLVDGRTPISDIVESTGISRFEVCKILIDLLHRSRVRLLTVPETMDLAVRRMNEGQRERGLRMYLAAASQAPGDAKVLSQVAKFLESEGLAKEAASHHMKAGRLYMEQGDHDRALDHMTRASNANPDDPEIQMGMFEVHASSGNLVEGKELAKKLASAALMAADLPRARKLCDRILAADPEDLEFRILRAKALHRSNQRKELEEDLAFIRKNMPSDLAAAEKIQRELLEIHVRAPSSAANKPPSSRVPAQKKKGRGKGIAVAAGLVILAGACAAGGYEFKQSRDLNAVLEASRALAEKNAFSDARRGVDLFVDRTLSFAQRARARTFLEELESKQKSWDQGRKDLEERSRQQAQERMESLAALIEQERRSNPGTALQRARELGDLARKSEDAEFVRRAETMVTSLEKYIGDASQLKLRVDGLEKEGKLREAALEVDRLLLEYPNTDAARSALYPLDVITRPPGVKVSLRNGPVLGETPLRHRLRPGEQVRLVFDRSGYVGVEREVKNKTIGRILVELTEKREAWVLPVGVTMTGEPALWGDSLLVAGGSRLYALKTQPRRLDWFEALDGPIEGSPKAAHGRVYVSTSARGVYAIDPARPGKRVLWRIDAGDRVGGTPGVSPDGRLLYFGTADRVLHAVDARNGDAVWKRELPGEMRQEPLFSGGMAIVACDDGTLLGLKGPRPEDQAWSLRPGGTPGALSLSDGVLYVATADQNLYAIDAARGVQLWRRALAPGVSGRAVRIGSTVCAATRDGRIYFLDAGTGEPLWTFDSEGAIAGGLAASGSLVLFGSDDQTFYAVDTTVRGLAWRLKCKGKIRGIPAASETGVYFASEDSLYAVDLN